MSWFKNKKADHYKVAKQRADWHVKHMTPEDRWAYLQALSEPGRFYGDGGTIHSTGDLNIEVYKGRVRSVWFRCQMLPFTQHEIDGNRAVSMSKVRDEDLPPIKGVVLGKRDE